MYIKTAAYIYKYIHIYIYAAVSIYIYTVYGKWNQQKMAIPFVCCKGNQKKQKFVFPGCW